jgi:lysozyme family protein
LQHILGITSDGRIGPLTLKAVESIAPDKLVDLYCDKRLEFIKGIKNYSLYGKGWKTRIDDVRKFCKHWIAAEKGQL